MGHKVDAKWCPPAFQWVLCCEAISNLIIACADLGKAIDSNRSELYPWIKSDCGVWRRAMVSANDVAAYILVKMGCMTTMKLQKLIYYAQAWSLVWDEEALFSEKIEAWANGPVVRELYDRHKGRFEVSSWEGNPRTLSKKNRETIDAVLQFYGSKTSQWLSDLTHSEDPWRKARHGLSANSRSNQVITRASMSEYYGSLQKEDSTR
jgi:uncharacterized phage-associated protein